MYILINGIIKFIYENLFYPMTFIKPYIISNPYALYATNIVTITNHFEVSANFCQFPPVSDGRKPF